MSKGISKEEMTLNQQIEDMRDRMRMLQNDRKANIDVLEANKISNKEEIRRLREENKDFRQKLAQLQKAVAQDEDKDEYKHVEREVEHLRKAYDEMRLKSTRFHSSLERLRDSVKDLELDSQRPHMEDNEYTRCIRALENKLDKAMIKYNEAQSIRKTYEQIVRRLKEERVGFDNQLAAIERTLGAKQRDYEELLLLAGDANHARETALGELDRVRSGYEEERKRREKELRERHQVVQLRRQMLDRMKQREKMRNTIIGNDGNSMEKSASMSMAATLKTMATDKIEARNKIDIFENAFRKIKEATGVSDVNEVIQKIVSQESTTENLVALTRENQGKVESLNELKRKVKGRVEELKYSGIGGGHRRKMVDDFEDQLANSGARLERSRLKYERLSKVIISMKAGVGHLQDKLESVREEVGGKRLELADDTVAEVLRECELCLGNVIRRIRAGDDDKRKNRFNNLAGNTPGTAGSASAASLSLAALEETSNMSSIRPYNQRIDLSLDEPDDLYGDHGDDNGAGAGDLEDEELTREKVKRAANSMLADINRKKRKPKKKAATGTVLQSDD